MAVRWVVDDSPRFLSHHWDDEAAVYDTLTGDTHLLEPVAVEVVAMLRQGHHTSSDLANALADRFAISPEDDILAVTESTLKRLEAIGIAVAVCP